MTEPLSALKIVHTFPQGEAVVSMVQFKGRTLVATDKHIYEIRRRRWRWVVDVMKFLNIPQATN